MQILYAGDSPLGGSANYLLGVLRALHATVRHLPPATTLSPELLTPDYDAIIFSDFSHRRVPDASQRAILRCVEQGTGFLMIGGWASFAGSQGHWRGSHIESLLPVRCLARDDRRNFPSGALIVPASSHPSTRGLSFSQPPVICGVNEVRPSPRSRVVLHARRILTRGAAGTRAFGLQLEARRYPLLIVDAHPRRRVAALTTDVAPHWCGGLVDWGKRRVTLPVTQRISVEVGDRYVALCSSLIRWLARAESHGR